MWAVAAALVPHELPPEVEIRLILIMRPAAQRDVARLVLSAFPIRSLVMVLDPASGLAASTPGVDECATTPIALPQLAPERCRDGARSSIAAA